MSHFQDAGALRRGSFYVERRADTELFEALLAGEFCYVLAPRQIGKSSLRVRTEARLRERGVRCASIDLTRIGSSDVTAEQWYFSLIEEMALALSPDQDPAKFWTSRAGLPPAYRFTRFLLDELLETIQDPIVVSFDEIDVVLSLPFPHDEFFAAMRAVYDARADKPAYERLTFCLFGVAAPSGLMENPLHTPFNIGRAIRLDDFTPEEATAFLPGLERAGGNPEELLEAVLEWTSGHPYMTQRTSGALAAQSPKERHGKSASERVDEIVHKLFIERGLLEDANLVNAEGRVKKAKDGTLKTEMFRMYRRLLYGGHIPVKGNDAAQQELRLAGMVSERADSEGARMTIRNRIFERVFDHRWVDKHFSENPLTEPIVQWLRFNKEEDFLLRGVALDAALVWAKGREDLTVEEREFLEASKQLSERRKAAQRAARERAILASLIGAVILMLLTAGALLRERALRMEIEQRERELEGRYQQDIEDIKKVQEEAESKAAEATSTAKKSQEEADKLKREATELEAKGTASQQEAKVLRQRADQAEASAESARKTAEAAKKLAEQAKEALKKSQEEAKVAQSTLETERKARELVEKQLVEETNHRKRIEGELREVQQQNVDLGKHQFWPSTDKDPAQPPSPRGNGPR